MLRKVIIEISHKESFSIGIDSRDHVSQHVDINAFQWSKSVDRSRLLGIMYRSLGGAHIILPARASRR